MTLEVSSHALTLGRVDGVRFDLAVFTNLTQDHLDFHGNIDDYFAAKAELFTLDRAAAALVCIDDPWGRGWRLGLATRGCPSRTYTVADTTAADWTGDRHRPRRRWVAAPSPLAGPGGLSAWRPCRLPGRFNVANARGGHRSGGHHGVDPEVAAAAVGASAGVPGRMERVDDGQRVPRLVDYAHTPDAVEPGDRGRARVGSGRVAASSRARLRWGPGPDKRPLMGQVAARDADVVDHHRRQSTLRVACGDPDRDHGQGASGVEPGQRAEVHRGGGPAGSASGWRCDSAGPGDVVLVLGKGHEQGQEVGGSGQPVR